MFTRNKRDYRTFIFSAVIVTLILLIIALAWPVPEEDAAAGDGTNPSLPAGKEDAVEKPDPLTEDGGTKDFAENHTVEEPDMHVQNPSYYLVKRAGEQIAVFFCEGDGSMMQLETTEILYDLLGPDDQKLFEEGIPVKNQEELSALLQDFES
ncbi:MAG: hypothetical protein ACI4WY_09655 [Anaerovoracaceae bacterium]